MAKDQSTNTGEKQYTKLTAGRTGSDVVKSVSRYDSPHGAGSTKSDVSKGGVTEPEGFEGDTYDADQDNE